MRPIARAVPQTTFRMTSDSGETNGISGAKSAPGMTVRAVRLEGRSAVRPGVMASPVEVLTLVSVAAPVLLFGEYAHTYVAFTCVHRELRRQQAAVRHAELSCPPGYRCNYASVATSS